MLFFCIWHFLHFAFWSLFDSGLKIIEGIFYQFIHIFLFWWKKKKSFFRSSTAKQMNLFLFSSFAARKKKTGAFFCFCFSLFFLVLLFLLLNMKYRWWRKVLTKQMNCYNIEINLRALSLFFFSPIFFFFFCATASKIVCSSSPILLRPRFLPPTSPPFSSSTLFLVCGIAEEIRNKTLAFRQCNNVLTLQFEIWSFRLQMATINDRQHPKINPVWTPTGFFKTQFFSCCIQDDSVLTSTNKHVSYQWTPAVDVYKQIMS